MDPRSRILVVDDEPSNRELLEALISELGHDVDLAADGVEALATLNRSHDLVLLDVMMPGIDGFEVARRIRAEPDVCDIPICMVTALSSKEERLRAVEAGADDFITKPIDKLELKVRTTSLLKAKLARDEARRYQAQLEAQHGLLEENFEKLSKLSEQKDDFVRMASHDLKNPLTCILGFAAIIDSELPPGAVMTEQTHGWASRITANCRIMQKIIGDFLDFQALEDGQIKLTLAPIDLNVLAADVIDRNAGYAEKKRITILLDLEPCPLPIQADKSRVNQVLENFLSNAIKFSPEDVPITLRTRRTDAGALVEISDAGPGISPDDMKNLFVKYAKLSNLPTGGESTTGLGLAICKKVVELQGGKTGARNNPEGGSTFWFELPTSLKAVSSNLSPVLTGSMSGTPQVP